MSGAIEVFEDRGWKVRTVLRDGVRWLVAKDVCACLGIANSRDAVARLDRSEKGVAQVDTPGGRQRMAVVSEAGACRLTMRSDKPDAVEFQMWLAHDVVPSIAETGSYSLPSAAPALPDPATAGSLLRDISAISRKQLAAMVIEAEELKELAEAQRDAYEASALAYEDIVSTGRDSSVSAAAKLLSRSSGVRIGPVQLRNELEAIGWMFRDPSSGDWVPKQTVVNRKWAVLRKTDSGYDQVRITPAGLRELHAHFGGGQGRFQLGIASGE